jgi:hypothetical protein
MSHDTSIVWRYLYRRSTVKHALHNDQGRTPALCGASHSWHANEQSWLGDHDAPEREKAAGMRQCQRCAFLVKRYGLTERGEPAKTPAAPTAVLLGEVFKHKVRKRWVLVEQIEGRQAKVSPVDAAGQPVRGRRTWITLTADGCGLVFYTRQAAS